jgi:hypothetical protein
MGGEFSLGSGSSSCANFGRYDGWPLSRVGSGTNPFQVNDPVYAMVVFDTDGPGPELPALFICGRLTFAGGVEVNGLASWNGHKWVGWGTPELRASTPRTMIVYDENRSDSEPAALYIGGDQWLWKLNSLGLHIVNKDQPLEGVIHSLAIYDGVDRGSREAGLFVGGEFRFGSEQRIRNIARWHPQGWQPLGNGLPDPVYAMAVYDDDGEGPRSTSLFAGQGLVNFQSSAVMRWDGRDWSAVGNLAYDNWEVYVRALTVFDEDGPGPLQPNLILGGDGYWAKWNGQNWSTMPSDIFYYSGWQIPPINALASAASSCEGSPELLAAMGFRTFSDPASKLLAKWDGQWSYLWNGVGSSPIAAVTRAAGGTFLVSQAGSALQKWDARAWHPFAQVNGQVTTMLATRVNDGVTPELFVAGGMPVGNIASWSSARGWQAVEPPYSGPAIKSMHYWLGETNNPLPAGLYVSGDGGYPMRVDQSGWHGLIQPFPGGAFAKFRLAFFDDDADGSNPTSLICGGSFTFSDGNETIINVGRWDGSHWRAMHKGLPGRVFQLSVVEQNCQSPVAGRLFATGFLDPSSPGVQNAMCWNGTMWRPIKGFYSINRVGSYDADGDGPEPPRLYVIGKMVSDNSSSNFFYRWSASGWESTTAKFSNAETYDSLAYDDDNDPSTPDALYITTPEFTYGKIRSNGIARYGSPLKMGLIPPSP